MLCQRDILCLDTRRGLRVLGKERKAVLRTRHVTRALSTPDRELAEYILQGPLVKPCKLSADLVASDLDEWKELGDLLIRNLGFPERQQLDEVQRLRIFHYYLPIFFWCQDQLRRHKESGNKDPIIIGMQAPQGCGKTTLVEQLEELFSETGSRAASVSIDDFYLTFEDQQKLAQDNPGNRLVELRSNAGTHDVDFGLRTLQDLKNCRNPDHTAYVPRYDKSAHSGRGTRADPNTWPHVHGPVDVILFEGWMLGFTPISLAAAKEVGEDLAQVNEQLKDYQKWHEQVDAWLIIKVDDPAYVYRWREQAEAVMREKGKGGMTQEQVRDFVDRYMPAYKAYLPHMYSDGPDRKAPGRALVIEINEGRGLVAMQPEALW